jgi:hypothetical protein
MPSTNRHTDTSDEEYTMPSMEALLAGTMALMTGYAQSARECPHRPLMAGKLVSNLLSLSAHPQLSLPMQTMLANLRTRWQLELERTAGATATDLTPTPLWHSVPASVQ